MGGTINESERKIKYEDTMGGTVSRMIVNYGKDQNDSFVPAEEMAQALSKLTGKNAY